MKVVILAGGYGTRISEESHLRPKPMIEIGEKPILGFSIGIPGFGHDSDAHSYYTNTVYQNNDGLLETDEDE